MSIRPLIKVLRSVNLPGQIPLDFADDFHQVHNAKALSWPTGNKEGTLNLYLWEAEYRMTLIHDKQTHLLIFGTVLPQIGWKQN